MLRVRRAGKNLRAGREFVLFCASLKYFVRHKLLKEGQMRILLLVLLLGFAAGSEASDPSTMQLNLLPMPSSVQPGSGTLPISAGFSVAMEGYREPRLERAVERF